MDMEVKNIPNNTQHTFLKTKGTTKTKLTLNILKCACLMADKQVRKQNVILKLLVTAQVR